MSSHRIQGILERGASPDLWKNTLAQIHSVYGRLVYLSALRDPNSGRYHHDGLAQVYGTVESDLALRTAHRQVFSEWICYDLEQQKADIDLYLSDLWEPRNRVIANWLELKPYRTVVPAHLSQPVLETFLCDFEVLLSLLSSEADVDAPESVA